MDGLRKYFPILESGLIYFDSAASSLTPEPVLAEVLSYYRTYRANVHRGVSRLSRIASEKYDEAHEKVASFIGVEKGELSFTLNATYGINLVALALDLKKGERVVTSEVEHHSNLLPWLRLKKKGVSLEVVSVGEDGVLSPEKFEEAVDEKTRIVSVAHVSNSVGAIQPITEIGEIARDEGALFLVDAAQSIPHKKVDVKKIGCDFLVFSGHKMLGPTGTGGLYISREVRGELEPPIVGGGTVEDVDSGGFRLTDDYSRWEAGTPNIAGAIGLAKAVDFLKEVGMRKIEAHEKKLSVKAAEGLSRLDGVRVYGPKNPKRAGIVSFNVYGLSPHDVSVILDGEDITVRSGFQCAIPYIKKLSAEGIVRASFYLYNTREEVERFLSVVEEICLELG